MKRSLRNRIKSTLGLCNAKGCFESCEYTAEIKNPVGGEALSFVDLCEKHMDYFVKSIVVSKEREPE